MTKRHIIRYNWILVLISWKFGELREETVVFGMIILGLKVLGEKVDILTERFP